MQPQQPIDQATQPVNDMQQPQAGTATESITPPVPGADQNVALLRKKIQNAGRSTFLLGCLLVVLILISLLAFGSTNANMRVILAVYLVLSLGVGVYWIVAGRRIMKSDENATVVLKTIHNINLVSIALFVVAVAQTLLGGGIGVAVFALVLVIYLMVAGPKIKQLSQ